MKEGQIMKTLNRIVWGVVLIAIAVLFALNSLDIIDLSFKGWWTLFIIIPCGVGLATERDKTGNLIGLAIGVGLLLLSRDIISFSMLWKLAIPVVLLIIGLRMIFSGFFNNKTNMIIAEIKQNGGEMKENCATFSSSYLNYDSQVFEGAELTAVFGGIKCDLRNAIIEKDCAIQLTAVFGGIDILVPDNINVKVSSNCFFGGITNKTSSRKDAPTLYINGTCMFGGTEIK